MLDNQKIKDLSALPGPLLTVYLNTRNADALRHPVVNQGLVWFRREAARLAESLPTREAERFRKEVDRVDEFLADRAPAENAVVIFSGRHTWTVLPLYTEVVPEVRWGTPFLGQLFRMLHEHRPFGAVIVDHHAARFFSSFLGEWKQLGDLRFSIDESQWKRKDEGHTTTQRSRKGRGANQDLFEHRLEAQYLRLSRQVAERAVAFLQQHNLAWVFLVGPDRLIGPILKHIPSAVRAHFISVHKDLGKSSREEIARRLKSLLADHVQTEQSTEVRQLLDAADTTSVINPDEVLARLQEGRLRSIVVAGDIDLHLRRCTSCGLVSRSADSLCASCGGKRLQVTLLDTLPALADAHGTEVRFLIGEARQFLEKTGGLAGWVRQLKKAAAS